jgi:hypothetical protein
MPSGQDDKAPYLSVITENGLKYAHDRRVVEVQMDGTSVLRDPLTGAAYDRAGNLKPAGWSFLDDLDKQ